MLTLHIMVTISFSCNLMFDIFSVTIKAYNVNIISYNGNLKGKKTGFVAYNFRGEGALYLLMLTLFSVNNRLHLSV